MLIWGSARGVDKVGYFRGRQGGGRQADFWIFLGVDMVGVDIGGGVDMLFLRPGVPGI